MSFAMSRKLLEFVLTSLALLLASAEARAFPHVVQRGDTLASIAERFYGRIQYEKLLVAANLLDVEGGTAIVPGMRLEIPALGHRRIRRGETWAALAAELLGHPERSDVLAVANGTTPWLAPEEGAEIVVPYNLRVVANASDTIVTIAFKHMGDKNKAWVLDRYNRFKGRKIRRGDLVLVPVVDLPLTDEGRTAAATASALRCSEAGGDARLAQRKVHTELPALIADVRGGRYVEAVRKANRFLATAELTRAQLALVHRQLLEAYVALEAPGLAREACAEWQKHDRRARLDPITLSPKLVRACQPRAAESARSGP
jgi:hypothetical protein